MYYSLPADTALIVFDELPTDLTTGNQIGFQVQNAATGSIAIGRTTAGIVERPAGSGSYVVTFTAPSEGGNYIVAVDWSAGTPTPGTSRSDLLKVTTTVPVDPSGLGPIADAAKSHLGWAFDGLVNDEHYGAVHIVGKIEVVKRRLMENPPVTADEDQLDSLVIDYFGKLVALELIPAVFSWAASQVQSEQTGSDPVETTVYPDRIRTMEKVQATLLAQTRREEATVLGLIATPRLRDTSDGPDIDEPLDDAFVTADPRTFPRYADFPQTRRPPSGTVIS